MADVESQITPLVDCLLLIDRNVDLITPLLTQLTYEGLIDENFKIENSKIVYLSAFFSFLLCYHYFPIRKFVELCFPTQIFDPEAEVMSSNFCV